MLQRLIGAGAAGLSRRGFLASSGSAAWCAACATDAPPRPAGTRTTPAASPPAPAAGTSDKPWLQPGYETYADPANPRLIVRYYRCHPLHALPPDPMDRPRTPQLTCRDVEAVDPKPPAPRHVVETWRVANRIIGDIATIRDPADRTRPLFEHPYPADSLKQLEIVLQDLSVWRFRGGTHPNQPEIFMQNSIVGAEAKAVLAHEIFHRIQYKYTDVDWLPWPAIPLGVVAMSARDGIIEGGARFAEAVLAPGPDAYLRDGAEWFADRRQSLFPRIVVPTMDRRPANHYATGLFWKYVGEQHGRLASGLDTQRRILDEVRLTKPSPPVDPAPVLEFDPAMLRRARSGMRGPGHFDRMLSDPEGGYVATETTWGNFLAALVLHTTATQDSRFRFRDASRWATPDPPRLEIADERVVDFAGLPVSLDRVAASDLWPAEEAYARTPSTSERLRESTRWMFGTGPRLPLAYLDPYGFEAWRVRFDTDTVAPILRVRLTTATPDATLLCQVVLLDRSGQLIDIYRSDIASGRDSDQLINGRNASEAVIVVASTDMAADYQLQLSRALQTPLLFSTNWNSAARRRLGVDPAAFAWSWRSPDLFLDDTRTTLNLRLSNEGNGVAEDVRARLFWKRAATFWTAAWAPLTKPLSGPSIAPCVEQPGRICVPPRPAMPHSTSSGKPAPIEPLAIETAESCIAAAPFRPGQNSCVTNQWESEEILHFDWPNELLRFDDLILKAEIRCLNSGLGRPCVVFSSAYGTTPPAPPEFAWPMPPTPRRV